MLNVATKCNVILLYLDSPIQNVLPVIVVGNEIIHRKGGHYCFVDLCHPQFALENDIKY